MNIEYGSCYKNVKEAAYNSVSTAMRRYASNMEDDCSYALHRMNRCVDCDTETFSDKLYFQSSKSLVEVYSRQLSGFVFEDYNYSDMYENGEDQLENIIVELYRLNNPNYNEESDSTNPNLYVDPSKDELVSTKTTNAFGAYSFTGLEPGYYYVLFRYDGDKYNDMFIIRGELKYINYDCTCIYSKKLSPCSKYIKIFYI